MKVQRISLSEQRIFLAIVQLASSRLVLTHSGDLCNRTETSNPYVRAVRAVSVCWISVRVTQRTLVCPETLNIERSWVQVLLMLSTHCENELLT